MSAWNLNNFDISLSMILYCIQFILLVLLCILYVCLFIRDNKSKIHIIILISLILSMIYSILSFIFIDGNVLLFDKHDKYECFYANLIFGVIILERLFLYGFNAYKLNVSFKDSVFEIKKQTSIIIYCILVFICCAYFVFIFIVRHHQNLNIKIIFIIFFIMDILCAFISLKIFAGKINKLLAIQMVDVMRSIVNKLTVLTIICIISSIIFILIPGIFLTEFILIKPYKIFGIDLLINNTCLLLSFGRGNRIYNKLCCCFRCNVSATKIRGKAIIASPTMVSVTENKSDSVKKLLPSDGFRNDNQTFNFRTDLTMNNQSYINSGNIGIQITKDGLGIVSEKKPMNLSNKNVSDSLASLAVPQNTIHMSYKNGSNPSRLAYKNYSNSLNVPALSSKDSISVSQQIFTKNINIPVSITMPSLNETKQSVNSKPKNDRIRRDSIDKFVTTMVELQEPSGIEGNEVEGMKISTDNITVPDEFTNTDIDWNNLTINIENNEDSYAVLKLKTPSTCVKQMKELGIIM